MRDTKWRQRRDRWARIDRDTVPGLRRRLRLLVDASFFFSLTALVAALYRAVNQGADTTLVTLGVLSCFFLIPIAVMRKTRSVELATAILTTSGIVGVSVLAYPNGGFFAAGLVWMAAIPLFATYIAGARQGAMTAATTALTLIAFFSLARYGFEFPQPPGGDYMLVSRLFSLVGLVFFVGFYAMRFESERKNALDAALQSQLDFQALIEANPEGIAVVAAGQILYANPNLASILGVEAEALSETNILDSPSASPEAENHVTREYERPDGITVQLELSHVTNIRFKEADAELIMIRDVSERNRQEAKLRVADRMASVGSLAAGMAHEINNPVTFIRGNLEFITEVLVKQPEIEEKDEILAALRDAEEGATKIAGIVDDMQSLARIKSADTKALDLGAALDAVVKLTAHQTHPRATVETDIADDILVDADTLSLNQVFVNLLVNAAEAFPNESPDNRILVSCKRDSERAVVEIRDNGPGIPKDKLARVFDPFYTTKDIGQGTGLGLSTCRELINAIGGELTLEANDGAGLVARVHLRLSSS